MRNGQQDESKRINVPNVLLSLDDILLSSYAFDRRRQLQGHLCWVCKISLYVPVILNLSYSI